MLLSTLADQAASVPSQTAAIVIKGIAADSRAVEPGFLFAALPGVKTDGAQFVDQAIATTHDRDLGLIAPLLVLNAIDASAEVGHGL